LLGWDELHRQRARDSSCDVGLHPQAILQAAVVRFRPHLCFVARAHQARRDAGAVALASRAALEQVVGAERLADAARPQRRVLEVHRRMRGHDAELGTAQVSELGGHLLGEAVAEVVAVAVGAHVLEGQHGQADQAFVLLVFVAHQAADEPVAAARHRLDELRLVGVVAERRAQPLHGGIQAVLEIHEGAGRPQPLANAVAGDHVSGLLEQQLQDLEGLVLQARAPVRRAQLAGVDVEFERAESDDWSHGAAPSPS
jgi:hypothetical protein